MKLKGNKVRLPRKEEPKMNMLIENGCLPVANKSRFQDSNVVSCRMSGMKRLSPYCLSQLRVNTGHSCKRKATIQDNEFLSAPLEKVDAVAYPREILGERNMHASCGNHLEHNDSDSDASSVGSCSVVDDCFNRLSSRTLRDPSQDADSLHSSAESFGGRDDEEDVTCPLPHEEAAATRIHTLELHAYRSILVAMYASGPMSWEQEALLTNLRLSLNISNDEHLIELRNLISSRGSLHIS
ncbi:ENT domain-containing protein [Psidium guajava]|nr:ENT domain-containing protein [Psidium guajava]